MNRYALVIVQEFIVYDDTPAGAHRKLENFLKKKVVVTDCRELASIDAEPPSLIVDISPINQRKP